MILAIDTSTAACTAALFDAEGECIARRDEIIGRGHSERLVPMISEMLEERIARHILVGVGPGSFTGIRVGVAAAHGLVIGWGCSVSGMSSLALLAAGADVTGPVAAVVNGGHGELFVQQFDGSSVEPLSQLFNLPPEQAVGQVSAELFVGPGARLLADAAGKGEAADLWPSASSALRLPEELRTLPAAPVYARAPDAWARSAA